MVKSSLYVDETNRNAFCSSWPRVQKSSWKVMLNFVALDPTHYKHSRSINSGNNAAELLSLAACQARDHFGNLHPVSRPECLQSWNYARFAIDGDGVFCFLSTPTPTLFK